MTNHRPIGTPAPGSFWTPRRQAKLAELVAEGRTATGIAHKLGDGCTKNMVIGRLYRNGQSLTTPSNAPTPPSLDQRLRFERVKQRGCVWVIGDARGEWSWCGDALVDVGKPYCAKHAAEARGQRQPTATEVKAMPGRAIGLSRASIFE